MSKTKDKNICPVPWNTLSLTNSGDYRLCVQANTHRETRGLLKDKDERTFNAIDADLDKVRNSELLKEIRVSMLKGLAHPICERCHKEEATKNVSRRIRELKDLTDNEWQKMKDNTDYSGAINTGNIKLKHMDLRLGNKCNLSCRSCYPGESTGWYKEWFSTRTNKFSLTDKQYIYLHEKKNNVIAVNDGKLKWFEKAVFFEDKKNLLGLKNIHIVGGEPLLVTEHYRLLQSLIDMNVSKNITLDYNSNLTIVPKKIISLWREFKKIELGVSLDGSPQINDYIRGPSKMLDVLLNIRNLKKELSNAKFWLTTTIMNYNILDFPNFIKYIRAFEEEFSLNLPIKVHQLQNPQRLNVSRLPEDVKSSVIEIIEKKIKELNIEKTDEDLIRKVLGMLTNGLGSKTHLKEFLDRTSLSDKYREQSMQKSIPELYSLLDK